MINVDVRRPEPGEPDFMPCLGVLTIGRRVERDDGFIEITVSVCSPNQLAWFEAREWAVGRLESVPEEPK